VTKEGYDSSKDEYEKTGILLTKLFNKLNKLYKETQNSEANMLPELEEKLIKIEEEYYGKSKSKQILFSDWYAHYKFFWQAQIDWIDEQKRFKLLRDKIPLTFYTFVLFIVAILIYAKIKCT
jgi:hypothetical protein